MSTQTLPTQLVASRDNVIARPRRDVSLRQRLVETLIEWRRRINSRRELAQLSEARPEGYRLSGARRGRKEQAVLARANRGLEKQKATASGRSWSIYSATPHPAPSWQLSLCGPWCRCA
jgi:uncharacterized protein YjiS (DUF1127 family)